MKPITPKQALKKVQEFPPEVIESFNECIAASFHQGSATVKQKDVVAKICAKMDVSSDTVFDKYWLDVEQAFKKAGWKVEYDKPGYCENYEAFFVFSK